MLYNMDLEWAPCLGGNSVTIVRADVSFDAGMIGVLFRGRTFSGHFFEMVICHLAAGGAAVLLAEGVNQSQTWAPHRRLTGPFVPIPRHRPPGQKERAEGARAAGRKGNSLLSRLWMFTCTCTKL